VITTIHRFDYLSGKWGWFARTCLRLAEQISLRVPQRVIVVSPSLQAHYQAQGYPVVCIPNGVTLPSAAIGAKRIADLGLIPNQYLLYLGRLVPEKRPDWAIRACRDSLPETMRLVIVGGSSATDRYVQTLRELAEPAADRIVFTGAVYGPLKEELLANARAFLLPSSLEGLPITLLEAMSHGKPCLVSDIPPHRDVIQDGENGFLHRAADFDHLCRHLRNILHAEPTDLTGVGEAARATVAKGYDWEKIVDQIELLYERVLGTAQPVPHPASYAIAHDRPQGDL
jgi:glycosyltransferase involved in cell wall biosynthesis